MYANMCRQYTVQIYAIGSGECHWTQKVNLEELITSLNPSFPRNMWKLKEPLVCMWPSEGFRDTTQKMTRSQIKGDSVGFGGIACLSKGCRRFEDNADTDTWNTSKALRRRCVIRAPDHQDLVEKWRAPEIVLWENVCPSLWGVIWSQLHWVRGPGGCSVELALNSCCAYCDKIERGIERSRRHNKPVFHPAEHRVPAANLDFIAPWYLEWEILKLGSVFAFVSLLRKNKISPWTLLYLRNIFACYVFFYGQ